MVPGVTVKTGTVPSSASSRKAVFSAVEEKEFSSSGEQPAAISRMAMEYKKGILECMVLTLWVGMAHQVPGCT
ncbi:serine/threonine kinase [Cystobacter fuscus DSM 2262]|uniref:Serine/threonine kinase n=1 Tax=Cystobacter fuscus (strain ATCC 25194 / DSM 2262 / NBRC 100088 / M29) TaxID=1242864 RepID=S9Q1S4_CYSF2|nr:serine/threonine kinase [Cystobacter fuscus DSM 2262]